MKTSCVFCQPVKWSCHISKSLDKPPVVICKSQKLLNLFGGLGHWPGCYLLHLFRVYLQSIHPYYMSQVPHIFLQERALVWSQLESSTSDALKHCFDVIHVFPKGFSQNNDIVQVHQAPGPLQTCQYQIHQALERSWGIAETKWHHLKFKQALGVCKMQSCGYLSVTFQPASSLKVDLVY